MRFIYFFVLVMCSQFAGAQSKNLSQVRVDSHYLTTQNGHPFFWMGDTEWELFHQLSVSDAKSLVAGTKKTGIYRGSMSMSAFFRSGSS